MRTTMLVLLLICSIPHLSAASALSDTAATLHPGEWKQLPVINWNRAMDYIDVNGADGSTAATDWSDNLVWVPSKKQVLYLGAGHLRAHKFIRYRESDNTFFGDPNMPACFKVGGYGCFTHGYDHQSYDPVADVFYYKSGGGLYTLDLASETWSATGVSMPGGWGTGTDYFQAIRYLFSVNGGTVAVRHADSTNWRTLASSVLMGAYHNKATYSVRHRRIYFGGGNGSPVIYSLDTAFRISRIADVPTGTIHVANSCLTTDPVTGTPLFIPQSSDPGFGLYSFDTSANAWFPETAPPFTQRALATPIPEYGVTLFLLPSPGFKAYLYRFASAFDTLPLAGVKIIAPQTTLEQYLSVQFRVSARYQDGRYDTTNRAAWSSLDTGVIRVSTTGLVTGAVVGTARVVARKIAFSDTVTITVTSSTAVLDSIVLNRSSFKFMVNDTFALHAAGYFTKGADRFTRMLDTVALWQSVNGSVTAVTRGLVTGMTPGGPSEVTVSMDGKSAACAFTVLPRPGFIKRINFQVTSTPFRYGWLAENGQSYSAAKGHGWLSGSGLSTRDDRSGTNFLLKSFVQASPQANFRIQVPPGSYIVRIGMGDATYGSATSPNWTVFGADTLVRHAAKGNTVRDNRVTVNSDSGLILGVFGPINYLVLISDQGIDMNLVADDEVTGVPPAAADFSPLQTAAPAFWVGPNPFNGSASMRWSLPNGETVRSIRVFNAQGRQTAAFGLTRSAGRLDWNARGMASGVYLVRLTSARGVWEKRVLLMR